MRRRLPDIALGFAIFALVVSLVAARTDLSSIDAAHENARAAAIGEWLDANSVRFIPFDIPTGAVAEVPTFYAFEDITVTAIECKPNGASVTASYELRKCSLVSFLFSACATVSAPVSQSGAESVSVSVTTGDIDAGEWGTANVTAAGLPGSVITCTARAVPR